jgi:DNA-binding MarR family transcriptional regulator
MVRTPTFFTNAHESNPSGRCPTRHLSGAEGTPTSLVMGRRATSRELADAMGVTTGNIPGLLDKLEAEGLVTRARSTKDRRAVNAAVTAKGRAEFREMVRGMVDDLVRAFEGWTNGDLAALGDPLARLLPQDRCPPGTIAKRSPSRRSTPGPGQSENSRSPSRERRRTITMAD